VLYAFFGQNQAICKFWSKVGEIYAIFGQISPKVVARPFFMERDGQKSHLKQKNAQRLN
jgi:hypothetical protein